MGRWLFCSNRGLGYLAVDLLGLFDADADDGDADDAGGEEAGGGILSALRYFRTTLYFCAGFGPTGLAAGLFGYGVWPRLMWGLGAGVAASLVARALYRLQHHNLDSSVSQNELLAERAVVTVPIPAGRMGKVRLRLGAVVVERFAVAVDAQEAFGRDALVQIVEARDDRVIVEKYQGARSLDDAWWRELGQEGEAP